VGQFRKWIGQGIAEESLIVLFIKSELKRGLIVPFLLMNSVRIDVKFIGFVRLAVGCESARFVSPISAYFRDAVFDVSARFNPAIVGKGRAREWWLVRLDAHAIKFFFDLLDALGIDSHSVAVERIVLGEVDYVKFNGP